MSLLGTHEKNSEFNLNDFFYNLSPKSSNGH